MPCLPRRIAPAASARPPPCLSSNPSCPARENHRTDAPSTPSNLVVWWHLQLEALGVRIAGRETTLSPDHELARIGQRGAAHLQRRDCGPFEFRLLVVLDEFARARRSKHVVENDAPV